MKKQTVAWITAGLSGLAGFGLIFGYVKTHPKEIYDLKNMLECHICKKLIGLYMCLTLIKHLIRDHGCTEDMAYEAMQEVGERKLRRVKHD